MWLGRERLMSVREALQVNLEVAVELQGELGVEIQDPGDEPQEGSGEVLAPSSSLVTFGLLEPSSVPLALADANLRAINANWEMDLWDDDNAR